MNVRKRTYKTVAVVPSGERFAIVLDDKPARIGSVPLKVPTRALAEAVAEEWRGRGAHLDTTRMHLTALAGAALTRVRKQRGAVIEHILGFGRSDLLCYRAAEPRELAERQTAQWDPLLVWVRARYGIRMVADAGISFIEQPVDAPSRMQEIVSALDDFKLAALDGAAALCASFVVALALLEQHMDADEAFAASHLDELYQTEKWGRDTEAEARRASTLAELKAIERFALLLN